MVEKALDTNYYALILVVLGICATAKDALIIMDLTEMSPAREDQ